MHSNYLTGEGAKRDILKIARRQMIHRQEILRKQTHLCRDLIQGFLLVIFRFCKIKHLRLSQSDQILW